MLKCYRVYYKTIVKGYHIDTKVLKVVQKEQPCNKTMSITWENIEEIFKTHGLVLGFNLYSFNRGRRISFSNMELKNRKTWDIKEWKESKLDITLEIEYDEYTPTIEEVLKWYDGDTAIQYLVERGLSIIK